MSSRLKDMFEPKPPKSPEKPDEIKPTSIRFTAEERQELTETAKALGVTISDVIRWRNAWAIRNASADAMREYLEPSGGQKLRMP
jgi:hypothetical protein